ncbi:DUF1636 domain-containing protein [Rhodovulum sulfidophilum]|uniref:DUF1636 family protein n=1 Tax=Rhodovulum sulfidophilum TaxID=35806 RepID=UPI0019228287|nr:DUF1636 domain-containing protein [Rhodovulum sulfidophilum]MBL3572815.1 DUF1636 domain-containing protein [Rhodovulum sulfidophilum]MCE8433195.1 DUF1636 domain-containing protein [Rhodovulum sulfidophilum]MCF4117076.1 DUF1636 domain-containing protein [Rhodovulum sulfidophilum]
MSAPAPPAVELLVCTTCKRRQPADPDAPRPGSLLHDAVRTHGLPEGVRLVPVECLSACSSGCTVALRGPGRWTYVYGNLDETTGAPIIAEGVRAYRDAPDGLVPWRQRPEHFRKNCIARIPPMEALK